MRRDIVPFILACVCVVILMVICKAFSNAIAVGRDRKKKAHDQQMGLYQESRPENLSDRFK